MARDAGSFQGWLDAEVENGDVPVVVCAVAAFLLTSALVLMLCQLSAELFLTTRQYTSNEPQS